MTCPICCAKFSKRDRLEIICPNSECGQSACRICVKTYLLDSVQDPHCMHCRVAWDQGTVKEALTATFLKSKEYVDHRKAILLEREKGKIPATQQKVATEVDARRLEKLNLADEKTIAELQAKIDELHLATAARRNTIYELRTGKKKPQRREFIMPCPDEGCKGFLSTAYKCAVCEKFSCPKCLVTMGLEKDANHTCDQALVDTVEAIRKDSKPCPKCGISTSKIDGCNQMWCVECHAAWDWRTGDLVNGTIHNPHYFQWAREASANGEIPRQPGDGGADNRPPCQNLQFPWGFWSRLWWGEIDPCDPHRFWINTNKMKQDRDGPDRQSFPKIDALNSITRLVIHLREDQLPQERQILEYTGDDQRVQFILGDISEEIYSGLLYSKDNNRRLRFDRNQIYEMFQMCANDILGKMSVFSTAMPLEHVNVSQLQEFKEAVNIVYEELCALIKYCNNELSKFSVNHNTSVNLFSPHSGSGYISTTSYYFANIKFTRKQITTKPFEYTERQLFNLTDLSVAFLTE